MTKHLNLKVSTKNIYVFSTPDPICLPAIEFGIELKQITVKQKAYATVTV